MRERHVVWLSVLVLVSVGLLAFGWAFVVEDMLDPYLPGDHAAEVLAEKVEFLVIVVVLTGLGLIVPSVISLKQVAQNRRDRQAIAELAKFPEQSPEPVLRIAASGEVLFANDAAQPILAEWGGGAPADWVEMVKTALQSGQPAKDERRFGDRFYSFVLAPVQASGYVNLFGRDVTQRHANEESLKLSAAVFENSAEAILMTDADGVIIACNPALCHLTGYREDELIGNKPRVFKSNRHEQAFYEALWGDLQAKGIWRGEIWNRRKSGELFAAWLSIAAVRDETGAISRFAAIYTDITKRKETEAALHMQANFDPLTELPNRNLFHDRLGRALSTAKRHEQKVGLLFVDLDRFKPVNDTYGHVVGDDILRESAQRLAACVRDEDTVARLGGDEFVVILVRMSEPDHAVRVAEAILQSLSEPFLVPDGTVTIGASIGISVYPDHAEFMDRLIERADIAMYAAKRAGRQTYRFFDGPV